MNSDYIVLPVKSEDVHHLVMKHYLHCWPGVVVCTLGLLQGVSTVFGIGAHTAIGVIVFALPPRETSKRYGVGTAWELARLFIEDSTPKNTETWFMSRAIAYVKHFHPAVELLVSYADPAVGHHGVIYKAGNWICDGRTDQERKTPRCSYLVGNATYSRRKQIPNRIPFQRVPRNSKHRFIYWMKDHESKRQQAMAQVTHVLHIEMQDGSVRHRDFTRQSWEEELHNPKASLRFTHPPNECKKPYAEAVKTGNSDRNALGARGVVSTPTPLSPTTQAKQTRCRAPNARETAIAKALDRALREQRQCKAYQGNDSRGARQGAEDWVAEEVMIRKPKSLILVDAMNLVFRSHYALRDLRDDEKRPTGTYYGVIKAIQSLRQYSDRIVFCWDSRAPNWRKKIYPDYRATRKHGDDVEDIYRQLPTVCEVVNLLGYANVEVAGLEADDIIAVLAKASLADVVIYSTDKDLYQLLDTEHVTILCPNSAGNDEITEDVVIQEHGILACVWPCYLALGGDASDNIRPIPGTGPKGAMKLVAADARPDLAWDENPKPFRKLYPQLEGRWPMVQAAYNVVNLPRTLDDSRLGLKAAVTILPDSYQRLQSNREERLQAFTRFCAGYQLIEFMSVRREFFR